MPVTLARLFRNIKSIRMHLLCHLYRPRQNALGTIDIVTSHSHALLRILFSVLLRDLFTIVAIGFALSRVHSIPHLYVQHRARLFYYNLLYVQGSSTLPYYHPRFLPFSLGTTGFAKTACFLKQFWSSVQL